MIKKLIPWIFTASLAALASYPASYSESFFRWVALWCLVVIAWDTTLAKRVSEHGKKDRTEAGSGG